MDISTLLGLVPEKYAIFVLALCVACKIITVFVRPPQAGSKLAPIFQVVSALALNVGWAANQLQVGKTGVMVNREDAPAVKAAIPAIVGTANATPPAVATAAIATDTIVTVEHASPAVGPNSTIPVKPTPAPNAQ